MPPQRAHHAALKGAAYHVRMKVWVFTVSWNEADMMPFFLRHYSAFADRIVVWDENSTDGTREIVAACPKAEIRTWPWKGLDDDRFIEACGSWYKMARGRADWVMWPDVDELLYHPEPLKVLSTTRHDVLFAQGLALIGNGPIPTGPGQLYEQIKTGYPQDNYTKAIIWRPGIEISHTHGRHDAPTLCTGSIDPEVKFKLLHCHYFSPEYTLKRNRRNFERAVNKRFAWNYTPAVEAKKHRGTHTWVQDLIDTGQLVQVVP